MARDPLGGDAFAHAPPLDIRQARGAPVSLVEMDVAIDKRRQEQRAGKIDALAGWMGAAGRVQSSNKAGGDFNVGETTVGKARVGENHQMRLRRFAAAN